MIAHALPLPIRYAKKNKKRGFVYPTLDYVLLDVCTAFKQSVEMVKSKSRKREYVICRRIYSYVSGVLTKETCVVIAALINRDHTAYSNYVAECLKWFDCGDPGFISEWQHYVANSTIWYRCCQELQEPQLKIIK